jgi:ankyrin repeat protein
MRHYGCNVNSVDLEGNTALHLAAYYGHADVVATLLDSGLISDLTIKNKSRGETALVCAKAGQEAYGKATDKTAFCPLTVDVDQLREKGYQKGWHGTRVDFTTRNGWPGWVEIIRLLEAASVDKTQ